MATNRIIEATEDLTTSLRETNRAIVDTAVAAQERNLRYAQSTYENGIEVLKNHTANTRQLWQTLVEQSRRQQEAWLELARLSLDMYLDWLSIPFSYSQRVIEEVDEVASRK
jgi:hypothetical protein